MADNIVKIKFKATGNVPLEKAIKSLDKATKSLIQSQVKLASEGKKISTVHKQTTGSTNKLTDAQKKQTQRTRILGGSFAVLRSKLLIYNFAMGLGIRQTLKFAESASKLESVSTAFNTLTGSTNATFSSLNKLQQATNDTVSEIDLLTQANNALILGVTDNTDEMAEMFDIAQRLGRALGRDTASSVESLITGIGRQSRLMLDNIGIIVKAEEAYEAFAEANGTTADKLTDSQKKQAFFNATMESAKTKVSALGEETLTSQDIFDQFSASMSNLASAFGGFMSGGLEPVISGFTRLANSASDFFRGLTESPLETTIRQLKDLGAETESLMQLQKIQLQRNIAKVNQKLEESTKHFANIEDLQVALKKHEKERLKNVNLIANAELDRQKLLDEEQLVLDDMEKITKKIVKLQDLSNHSYDDIKKSADEELIILHQSLQGHRNIVDTLRLKREEHESDVEFAEANVDNLEQEEKFLENNLKLLSDKKRTEAELLALGKERVKSVTSKPDGGTGENDEAFKRSQELRKIVFGETVAFQIQQLEKLKSEFDRIVGSTVESEKYFASERMKIEDEHQQKINSLRAIYRDSEEENEINALVEHGNQMLAMKEELGLSEIQIAEFIENKIADIKKKNKLKSAEEAKKNAGLEIMALKDVLNFGKNITSAMKDNLDRKVENELNALKKTNAYQKASNEQRENMENQVNAKFAQEKKQLFEYNKGIALAEGAIGIAEKIIQYMGNPAMQAIITALGAVQLSTISKQQAPQFETGGLVGGRRHSQGGTLIEAEQGEFVMSRSAVQAIGLEQMNEINQGGTGGVTVNVTAPLVDETVVDSIIPAIEKATRLNLA